MKSEDAFLDKGDRLAECKPPPCKEQRLCARLAARHAADLYRQRRVAEGPAGPRRIIDGQAVLSFCSNDYLGLANHPKVNAACMRAIERYGVGSGAAHLVNGHTRAHQALEEELADFLGRERVLLFSTGYMANLGVIAALAGPGDVVFEDRLNHASLLDGARLSGARFRRYAHADADALARLLARSSAGERLIVSDGVFSMDGDLAPLPNLAELARAHDAWLLVDDAHGLGVLGARGRGTLEHFDLAAGDVPVLVGTLGKAFGTAGAFVAGRQALIEWLIQAARPYVYTTAMPAALAEATRVSLRLIDEEPWRRAHLHSLISRFRAGAAQLGLPLLPSATPIQPLMVGDASKALQLSAQLWQAGIQVTAIRPPTVPPGTARLRITLSAAHRVEDVDRLLMTLEKLGRTT